MSRKQIDLLLKAVDQAYDQKSWHGTNLKGSVSRVSAEEAVWRPAPGRHNIQELVVHAAYWKYTVRRRLRDEPRGSFPLKGSDWFERSSTADAESWKSDRRLLQEMHVTMREAIAEVEPARLGEIPKGAKTTILDLIMGIAAHDLHHAGQIQLLKRLQRG